MPNPSPSSRVVLGYWLVGLTWLAVIGLLTWLVWEGAGWSGVIGLGCALAAVGWLVFLFWLLNE